MIWFAICGWMSLIQDANVYVPPNRKVMLAVQVELWKLWREEEVRRESLNGYIHIFNRVHDLFAIEVCLHFIQSINRLAAASSCFVPRMQTFNVECVAAYCHLLNFSLFNPRTIITTSNSVHLIFCLIWESFELTFSRFSLLITNLPAIN